MKKDIEYLELMDFKEMERSAEAIMHQARKDIVVGKMMYTYAVEHVKRLGGTTEEQIRENARNTTV